MLSRITEMQFKILMIILVLTPLYSAFEIIAFFQGDFSGLSNIRTPLFIKLLKDIGLVSIISLEIFRLYKSRSRLRLNITEYVFVGAIMISLLATSLQKGISPMILAGLRWSIPFMFYFLCKDLVKEEYLESIYKILMKLFFIHLIIQVLQVIFVSEYVWGSNVLGLNSRNPGLFNTPSTAALFTVIVAVYYFLFEKNKKKRYILLLFPLSIYLTSSGVGIVSISFVYLAAMLLSSQEKSLVKKIIIAIIMLMILFNLKEITNRSDIMNSILMRIDIFVDSIRENGILFSLNFGMGTNTGVLLRNSLSLETESIIVDSLYTSLVYNIGLVGSMAFVVSLLQNISLERPNTIMIVGLFLMISITSIIVEAFPISVLIFIIINYSTKSRSEEVSNYA